MPEPVGSLCTSLNLLSFWCPAMPAAHWAAASIALWQHFGAGLVGQCQGGLSVTSSKLDELWWQPAAFKPCLLLVRDSSSWGNDGKSLILWTIQFLSSTLFLLCFFSSCCPLFLRGEVGLEKASLPLPKLLLFSPWLRSASPLLQRWLSRYKEAGALCCQGRGDAEGARSPFKCHGPCAINNAFSMTY